MTSAVTPSPCYDRSRCFFALWYTSAKWKNLCLDGKSSLKYKRRSREEGGEQTRHSQRRVPENIPYFMPIYHKKHPLNTLHAASISRDPRSRYSSRKIKTFLLGFVKFHFIRYEKIWQVTSVMVTSQSYINVANMHFNSTTCIINNSPR